MLCEAFYEQAKQQQLCEQHRRAFVKARIRHDFVWVCVEL